MAERRLFVGEGLAVLGLVDGRKVLEGRFALGPGGGVGRLSGPGAAVVVVQPHEVRVDDPQPDQRVGNILLVGEGDVEVVVCRRAVVGPAVGELHVTAPQLPQVVPGGERRGLEADAALFAQGDEESGFVLMGLGEGIFEGAACVADGVPPHLLGTVEVAQSHIVEALEEGDVDAVHPAHAGLFALADRRPGHELVGLLFVSLGITQGYTTVVLAHITFCTPYVVLSVLPRLKQMNPNIYEAALDLGATPMQALRKVIVPEILPGMISGFMLAVTLSIDDFAVTVFTIGNEGLETLSTYIYADARKGGLTPELRPLSTIIFVLVLVLLVIINRHASKKKEV